MFRKDSNAGAMVGPTPWAAPHPPSLAWEDGVVVVIDQRALPHEYRLLHLRSVDDVVAAIRTLAVRGAPAIGLTGALGVALSAYRHGDRGEAGMADVRSDAEIIVQTRPTAVNLGWAVRRVLARLPKGPQAVLDEALDMLAEDIGVNSRMVARAAKVVETFGEGRPLRLLTHCNTGRLATAGVGTALGVILELAARGGVAEVLVDETRPLLQGARLTAWELGEAGVPYRLCVDSAAAMAGGLVDCVLVGADRIAANGDTANKIGTYGLALAAARHGIPFVVVAPESSWDPLLPDGSGIVIEEREGTEVASFAGAGAAPSEARFYNPAFDVTPADLISAVVTQDRVFRPGPPSAAANELIVTSRDLYARGWMPGTSGNLSVRERGAGTALITASGRHKGRLTIQDGVVAVDVGTGTALSHSGPRASAETAIHAAVYRATDAGAVIHVHSPGATAVACRVGRDEETVTLEIRGLELLKGLGLEDPARALVPVFPNWQQVSRIGDQVEAYLAGHSAVPGLLIAHHGITVWGRDLEEALNRCECLESVLQLSLDAPVQIRTLDPKVGTSS